MSNTSTKTSNITSLVSFWIRLATESDAHAKLVTLPSTGYVADILPIVAEIWNLVSEGDIQELRMGDKVNTILFNIIILSNCFYPFV